MTQFFHFPIIVFTFILFLVFQGLKSNKDDDKEQDYSIVTSIVTLLFISTFTLIPYLNYQSALESIEAFNNGKSLQCNSTNNNFTNQEFLLDNKHWSVKGYQFINKDNGLIIEAHMCEEG